MPGRVALYLQTLRHLRPKQIAWYGIRRLLASRSVNAVTDVPKVRRLASVPFVPVRGGFSPPARFTFLNHSETFGDRVPWHSATLPRLWLYNLHYFDCAADPSAGGESVERLIANWIEDNPQGSPVAWEPYPLSLRTVNWIKFHLAQDRPMDGSWLASLYTQLRFLFENCEYHLGANHLFKNAKALFVGGLFFEGEEAARWLAKGLALIRGQIAEQVLSDGGHYERSFMYHAIVTEDVLDIANLAGANPSLGLAEIAANLRETGERMVEFLLSTTHPDGDIALFNDAAFGIAPTASHLAAYLARLDGKSHDRANRSVSLINHDATGYFGYRTQDELLVIDCGQIGPDHQPGHAHCDTLSFELSFSGRRVIVDSGTFDYEPTELRHYLRSTAAHNTVRIDTSEQSQIWATFRVGKRARPIAPQIGRDASGTVKFEGAHDGFAHLPGRPIHRRIVEAQPEKRWAIRDLIDGRGSHLVESFIHVHPELALLSDGEGWILAAKDRRIGRITVSGGTAEQHSAIYCPQFGIRQPSQCLVLRMRADLPTELGFVIERL
jgi:uncharacterized heparinase superfamily protein